MAKHDEFIIKPRRNGEKWIVEKPHAERASSVENSLNDAIAYAQERAPEGDIKIKGLDGKFAHLQRAKKK